MNRRPILALVLAVAALSACTSEKPAGAKHSSPATVPSASIPAVPGPDVAPTMELGTSAETVGVNGQGRLEITPMTVVYLPQGGSQEPENELFAHVVVKLRPTTAVSASPAVPISGGGWSWVAPNREAIEQGNGAAFNVVAGSFNHGGDVQPGTFVFDDAVFDLTKAQAGGTLLYNDGEGQAYRWRMPAQEAGPHVEKVKKELAP
ncbi:hypothetical protein [Streptomyces sp. NPDC002054]|uniref:hypothetical protein n=1 Tax=Streptomyces sp. NPDC002054 TaxID=3154663 RepID=UPI00332E1B9C